ncbi:MAG: hypothetical protein CSA70_03960 [Rhodobacterales bacterium]|nr:MAG: hypothetical protein CSA70_03960 [Rhodobacterales bacterium]
MSDTDSFIEEVTEEVRRDRLFKAFRRWGPVAAVVVVAIVGGAAWNEYNKAQAAAAAQATGDAMIGALLEDDASARAEKLAALHPEGAGAQAVATFLAAGEQLRSGDGAAAVEGLRKVANAPDLPLIYQQIAQFKLLGIEGADMSPEDRRAGYETLIGPGSGLRLLAEEQLALIDIETGNRDAALTRLAALSEDAGATPGLRRRASSLIVALGGVPEMSQ